jgi:hypothetical protein
VDGKVEVKRHVPSLQPFIDEKANSEPSVQRLEKEKIQLITNNRQ